MKNLAGISSPYQRNNERRHRGTLLNDEESFRIARISRVKATRKEPFDGRWKSPDQARYARYYLGAG
ncbi:hypothetical protein E4K64_01860 [Bradyrhizobium frederickii]|uniref:Uncharacterized protein n=1 Tax=Bradyrhizobium frederickii TaxID=2560054 RepID=A0A4Y9PJG3_9BRAD|nr:hypothetical protein [Bradyrhizobium frederickii]TFV80579.1 hypothetical protein E4K64_01860 [Bradyrhizobium frederickii]